MRILVIIILGVLFGLSPKKVTNLTLIKVGVVGILFCAFSVFLAAAFGFSPERIIQLDENHITVSGLTVGYALLLGVGIKLMRNLLFVSNT